MYVQTFISLYILNMFYICVDWMKWLYNDYILLINVTVIC